MPKESFGEALREKTIEQVLSTLAEIMRRDRRFVVTQVYHGLELEAVEK